VQLPNKVLRYKFSAYHSDEGSLSIYLYEHVIIHFLSITSI